MKALVPLVLTTPRLLLRQLRENDWLDLHQYYVDEVATRYTLGRTFSVGDTWHTLLSMLQHWQLRGFGPYAVEDKSSGKVIGTVGFWYPNDFPGPEIKWSLVREYWGQGFASEAARAVQQAGLQYLPDTALISLIHPDNNASVQLALAVGARYEKNIVLREQSMALYRHPQK